MSAELTALLARSWVFRDLDSTEMAALAKLASQRNVAARTPIVKKGEVAAQIFAVLRGRLKVVTPGASHDAALSIIGPGELFGEIAVLDGDARSATVTTLEPTQLAVIDHRDFIRLLDQYPAVGRKLLAVLARRVRALSTRVEDRAFLELPARLAKFLLRLSENYGTETSEGLCVRIRLSQQEIGELVDASRESVNKLFATWKKQELATHHVDRIVVHRPTDLQQLAEGLR
jgi:CRP/FNR family cyclic AMP-dependent transcriptional regulator